MKTILNSLLVALVFSSASFAQTNDFYDDAPLKELTFKGLAIAGEVAEPGLVDVSGLPVRDVIVKETLLGGETGQFTGAYLYQGYSLYDILNETVLKKKNESEFPPITDLFVEVENEKGEKAVISWGEIYYPIHRHEILVATGVRRIVPSKTKELWPLPDESRLIIASDLYTERNISNPVKITVRSSSMAFVIDRNIPDMYAGELGVYSGDRKLLNIREGELTGKMVSYGSVFYGRGTGIHGTTPFKGIMMKDYLTEYFPLNREQLMQGVFIVAAPDGYRAVFTYSEIFNRNDQAEVLIVLRYGEKHQGAFLLYPAADYFSDRSIRCLNHIRLVKASDL